MGKQRENSLHHAVRWGGRAIIALGLVYDILVGITSWFAPPGKSRRRLARKFKCQASMVPHALVCYTAIYMLAGLIILLCLCGFMMMFAG